MERSVSLRGIMAVFLGAFLLWLGGISLSSKLSAPHPTKQPARMGGNTSEAADAPLELSPELIQLERDIAANPKDTALKIAFAERMAFYGAQVQDVRYLMRSVQTFVRVLEQEPNNSDALIGLANVSFESGVFDRAADYYRRYLDQKPDDNKARTDFALTLIQTGSAEEAITNFKKLLDRAPKDFPANMGLALAYRVSGKKDQALKQAEIAKGLAPDDEGRAMLQRFVQEVENPVAVQSDTALSKAAPLQAASPAGAVTSFFRNHPIVGPKISSISWPEKDLARIAVKDFPVQQMPEFARQKFEGNVRNMLGSLAEPVRVQIVDDANQMILLEFGK